MSTTPSTTSSSKVPENTYCFAAKDHEWHGPYHDTEYGFPIRNDDDALFERLILEINQAGLSWLTILKKRQGFRGAYPDIDTVANFDASDEERLRNDTSIIRNKLKIKAAIYNAKVIQTFQEKSHHGSFEAWLDHHHPLSKPEWVKLFKKHFKFTGGEITKEFLRSLGYLPGAHHPKCAVYKKIKKAPWMSVDKDFDWEL